jgi:RimJ/RimL family protein N-acetyltransferase
MDPPRSPEQVRAWISRDATDDHPNGMPFVIETLERCPLGSANLRDWQNRAGAFALAIIIYRRFQRLGYASEAVRMLLRYGVHEFGYLKVEPATISCNEASIRMHLRLGFAEAGRLRPNAYTDEHHWDGVLSGMTCEECDVLEGSQ